VAEVIDKREAPAYTKFLTGKVIVLQMVTINSLGSVEMRLHAALSAVKLGASTRTHN
jgi:hypothetical protein